MPEDILIIEDDAQIAEFLRRGLAYEGYRVRLARDGSQGLAEARKEEPDLVILDLMLPGMDGLEVCRRLRGGSDLPILILTARGTVADRVEGLEEGADDYLVKPFAFEELLARIRAILRRRAPREGQVLTYADLVLALAMRQVRRGEREVELTAREFDLLEYLLRHREQVLTPEQIFSAVWGYDFLGESNIVAVYVRYLRSKLEAGGEPRLIQTVRGVGYALREGG